VEKKGNFEKGRLSHRLFLWTGGLKRESAQIKTGRRREGLATKGKKSVRLLQGEKVRAGSVLLVGKKEENWGGPERRLRIDSLEGALSIPIWGKRKGGR